MSSDASGWTVCAVLVAKVAVHIETCRAAKPEAQPTRLGFTEAQRTKAYLRDMHRRRFLRLAAGLPIPLVFGACDDNSPAPTATPGTPSPSSQEASGSSVPSPASPAAATNTPARPLVRTLSEYPVVRGSGPHDVAPRAAGGVWYTGQGNGTLGLLAPDSGEVEEVPLGPGARPHGVIVGPDGHAWVTDSGRNAIVRVHDSTREVKAFPLPASRANANLNTATFDKNGIHWFTGQAGIYGRLDPSTGSMEVFDAPRGRGPYGICSTPVGDVYYASLAGSHIARVDLDSGEATPIDPPTANQGARRVWSDSTDAIWVAEWNVGQVGRYDPATGGWREWRLPGGGPQAYAVFVDERDFVWLTDFGSNAIVSFDPRTEKFEAFPLSRPNAAVRQLLGRPGEVWGAESGLDALVVVRTT